MQNKIRLISFLQGCSEGRDKIMRKVLDEPNSIGQDNFLPAGQNQSPRSRVKRSK
ncbi:hypothetical protein D3C81_862790 [compost metagenome]